MPEQKPEPRKAGRRLEWPTLWHADQLPFPWGGAKRLTAAKARAQAKAEADKSTGGGGSQPVEPEA